MKISKFILNKVPFNPNYDEIKEKIDVIQYVEKKSVNRKKVFNIKLATSLVLSILVLCFGIILINNQSEKIGKLSDTIGNSNIFTKYVLADINIHSNDNEMIEMFDYVFIGKIVEEVETKKDDGTGTSLPYTFYRIKEIEFLKGEKTEKESLICFYGGMESKNVRVLGKFNDEILIEDNYYLFIVSKKATDSSNNRIGENDYVLLRNEQKILLNGYNENLSINEQNMSVRYTINRILNVINKELKNDFLNIPTFENDEELVEYYNYIGIVKIRTKGVDFTGTGVGSDIPAASYYINFLYTLKNEYIINELISLYTYGTNFWEDEKTFDFYTPVLEVGKCYLIFANLKDINDQNTRINENDFVIYDRHQLICLEGYNPNFDITSQSAEIQELVQKYKSMINR